MEERKNRDSGYVLKVSSLQKIKEFMLLFVVNLYWRILNFAKNIVLCCVSFSPV